MGFPGGSEVKNPPASAGDRGDIKLFRPKEKPKAPFPL